MGCISYIYTTFTLKLKNMHACGINMFVIFDLLPSLSRWLRKPFRRRAAKATWSPPKPVPIPLEAPMLTLTASHGRGSCLSSRFRLPVREQSISKPLPVRGTTPPAKQLCEAIPLRSRPRPRDIPPVAGGGLRILQ